jgi:crotonobetainyl-CoA:carnitine CoA-transferase CaiB-like acyl-CoA transferase
MIAAPQALGHLRVLDLSEGVAGSYCTKLMAGFGADVVKVERPGSGDPLRAMGPFAGDVEGLERSLPFLWHNTGKRSLSLDLDSPEGLALARRLAGQSDVVVETFKPGGLAARGLGFPVLKELNPRLVLTSISNFGQTGPYRDYEAAPITEYALSGAMCATGDGAREPLAAGPAISHLSAGMKAYIATLMGVLRARATGGGDWIDVSIQEAALDNIEVAMAERLHLNKTARRNNDEHALVPWRTYPCRDGQAAIIGGPIRHWLKAAEMFESPELVAPDLDHMAKRIANRQRVRDLMGPWLRSQDKKSVFHEGQARGLAFGYLADLKDVDASPQYAARGYLIEDEHPEIGRTRMPGAPFRMERTPWVQRRAPLLGEHTEAVLRELGLAADEIQALREEGVV